MMDIVNRIEVNDWLFERTVIQGHVCNSVKSEDLDEHGLTYNVAWIDKNTGERIEVIWDK